MDPTKWPPERALAMLRDMEDPNVDGPEFVEKWGQIPDPQQLAIDALEATTAEIERLRGELAQANMRLASWPRNEEKATQQQGNGLESPSGRLWRLHSCQWPLQDERREGIPDRVMVYGTGRRHDHQEETA